MFLGAVHYTTVTGDSIGCCVRTVIKSPGSLPRAQPALRACTASSSRQRQNTPCDSLTLPHPGRHRFPP